MEDWHRTYADGLACRWAAKHLELNHYAVNELVVMYSGATGRYSTLTAGDPSYMLIYAMVGEVRYDIHVGFADIIDGMVKLAAEERASNPTRPSN